MERINCEQRAASVTICAQISIHGSTIDPYSVEWAICDTRKYWKCLADEIIVQFK